MSCRPSTVIAFVLGSFLLSSVHSHGFLSDQPVAGRTPSLVEVLPRGGQRGETLDLTLRGERLSGAAEVLFYKEGLDVEAIEEIDAKQVRVRLKIDPSCSLGEHSLRLRTRGGLSELRTFWVGPLVSVTEVEPNSSFDSAQPVSLNVTLQGVVTNEDVDYFSFEAKKDTRVTAEIEGMRLAGDLFDPFIALLDAGRFEVAVSDDSGLHLQDGVASFIVPEDGHYVLEVREASYGGSPRCRYRVHLGTFPRPTVMFPIGGTAGETLDVTYLGDVRGEIQGQLSVDLEPGVQSVTVENDGQIAPSPLPFRVSSFASVREVEPNNRVREGTPSTQPLPIAFDGRIESAGDQDCFRVELKKGAKVRARVYARRLRSPLDSVLILHGTDGKYVSANDDTGTPDSVLDFTADKDGVYTLRIRDHLFRGGPEYVYRIEVTQGNPFLALDIPVFNRDSQARQVIAVPQGNRYATVFRAIRQNFRDNLSVSLSGAPEGVSIVPAELPMTVDRIPFVFEAPQDAPLGGGLATLSAKGQKRAPDVEGGFYHNVELVVGNPNRTVYYRRGVQKLAVAVVEPVPFRLDVEVPKVPLVRRGNMGLKVRATREEGFTKPITVRMLWNPPGIGSRATVSIPEGKDEVVYPINANDNARLDTWQIALLGETALDSGPVLVSTGLVPLEVRESYLTLAIDMAAIEQGAEGEVVCKVEPGASFDGQARVRLLGLPPKVTTQELTLTHGQEELVFPISVAEDAPKGKHKSLFCHVVVEENGHPISHSLGRGGVLRVDPKKKAVTAKIEKKKPPAKKPTAEKKPAQRRLSRLEKLRLAREEEKKKGDAKQEDLR